MNMENQTILVLGATGLLGQAIVEEFSSRATVVGVARKNADYTFCLTDDHALEQCITEVQPTLVINCAAWVNLTKCQQEPQQAFLLNTRLVGVLTTLCKSIDATLVQISTDHYYVTGGEAKHSEQSPIALCNEYARSKYLGESLALLYENSLIIRTNIVGFRRWDNQPTFVEWVTESLENQVPMTLFSDFYTSSIHTKQFASILADVVTKNLRGVINLASSEVASKKVFVEQLAQKFGFSLDHTTTGAMLSQEHAIQRANCLGLDVGQIEQKLGYPMPTLDEVLNSLYSEYQRIG